MYLSHTNTRTRRRERRGRGEGRRGKEALQGSPAEGTTSTVSPRGGASRRERRRGSPQPRIPQNPYNTVASRIRNLLLIIMLSILTRHSYFSPSPLPLLLLKSITRSDDAPNGEPRQGIDLRDSIVTIPMLSLPVGLAGLVWLAFWDFFLIASWIFTILCDFHHVKITNKIDSTRREFFHRV